MGNFDNFKVLILYFSGTGNTYLAANEIANILNQKGITTSVESVEVFDPNRVKEYDCLFFGFPIYALRMPEFLNDYTEKISLPRKRGVFVFSTYGIYPGNAMKTVARKLQKRGFIPIGTGGAMLPGTDGLLFIKKDSRTERKIKNKDYKTTRGIRKLREKALKSVTKILSEDISDKRFERVKRIPLSPVGIVLDILFQIIYRPMEKSFKKKFYADENCSHCKLCEMICPSHNITVTKTEVTFSNKCYLCLRCIHQCPEESIQIGQFTKNSIRYRGPGGDYYPLSILRSKTT